MNGCGAAGRPALRTPLSLIACGVGRSAAMLKSTAPRNYRFGDCRTGPGFGCAHWKDTLAAASDVTTEHGRPLAIELALRAARTGPSPSIEIIANNFNDLRFGVNGIASGCPSRPFLPGGKICRCCTANARQRDCLTGIRPILKRQLFGRSEVSALSGRFRAPLVKRALLPIWLLDALL